jgi:hypothetical protein
MRSMRGALCVLCIQFDFPQLGALTEGLWHVFCACYVLWVVFCIRGCSLQVHYCHCLTESPGTTHRTHRIERTSVSKHDTDGLPPQHKAATWHFLKTKRLFCFWPMDGGADVISIEQSPWVRVYHLQTLMSSDMSWVVHLVPEKVTPALCCSHAWLRMFPNLLNTPEHACLYYVTISFDTSTALCVLSVDACPGGLSSRFGLGAHLPVESSYCTASASLFLCWLKSQSSCGMAHWFASLANALQGPEFLGQPDYLAKAGRQAWLVLLHLNKVRHPRWYCRTATLLRSISDLSSARAP